MALVGSQTARLLHDQKPALQSIPYARTATRREPGCCYGGIPMRGYLVPMVVGVCVIMGLIIVDGGQYISPGPSLTAQERRPSQEQIARAQEQLKAAGYDPGSVDGVWGPQTEAAVRDFQQQHGLAVSGALDDGTGRVPIFPVNR